MWYSFILVRDTPSLPTVATHLTIINVKIGRHSDLIGFIGILVLNWEIILHLKLTC